MELQITELDDSATCVRLQGRLDAAGADRIALRFTAAVVARAQPAVVDLSAVSYIASMGIRLLLSSAKALNLKGARLVLFGAQPLVQQVLEETGMDQLLDLAASQPAALELARN